MKIVLLGITGSGKSTIAKKLAEAFNLELIEADDLVYKLNGDFWPEEEEIIDELFEESIRRIIDKDNLLFVISFLDLEQIEILKNNNFFIIEMHANENTLLERKRKRDGDSIKADRFKRNYLLYKDILAKAYQKKQVDFSIDTTNLTSENVYDELQKVINSMSSVQ